MADLSTHHPKTNISTRPLFCYPRAPYSSIPREMRLFGSSVALAKHRVPYDVIVVEYPTCSPWEALCWMLCLPIFDVWVGWCVHGTNWLCSGAWEEGLCSLSACWGSERAVLWTTLHWTAPLSCPSWLSPQGLHVVNFRNWRTTTGKKASGPRRGTTRRSQCWVVSSDEQMRYTPQRWLDTHWYAIMQPSKTATCPEMGKSWQN